MRRWVFTYLIVYQEHACLTVHEHLPIWCTWSFTCWIVHEHLPVGLYRSTPIELYLYCRWTYLLECTWEILQGLLPVASYKSVYLLDFQVWTTSVSMMLCSRAWSSRKSNMYLMASGSTVPRWAVLKILSNRSSTYCWRVPCQTKATHELPKTVPHTLCTSQTVYLTDCVPHGQAARTNWAAILIMVF